MGVGGKTPLAEGSEGPPLGKFLLQRCSESTSLAFSASKIVISSCGLKIRLEILISYLTTVGPCKRSRSEIIQNLGL